MNALLSFFFASWNFSVLNYLEEKNSLLLWGFLLSALNNLWTLCVTVFSYLCFISWKYLRLLAESLLHFWAMFWEHYIYFKKGKKTACFVYKTIVVYHSNVLMACSAEWFRRIWVWYLKIASAFKLSVANLTQKQCFLCYLCSDKTNNLDNLPLL